MAFGGEGSDGDERRKRRDALRALAESDALVPPSTPAPALGAELKRSSRRPPWLIPTLSAVALLAVVALVVARFLPGRGHSGPTYLALDPERVGVACLRDEAWSPDSAQIALVGAQRYCNGSQPDGSPMSPNVIVFVNGASGKSTSQILPDAAVEQAIKTSGVNAPYVIEYTAIVWSPDGKRLALPFNVTYQVSASGGGEGNPDSIGIRTGLAVVNVDGTPASVLLVPDADTMRFSGEWNLKTGKPMLANAVPSGQSVAIGSGNLTPALRYTWQSDGSLVASDSLTPTSAARPQLGPVGNPDGGASFTAWQPMSFFQNTGDPAHPVSPAPFVAITPILAWSPDGTYLMNGVLGPVRIQPSKQPVPGPDQLKATFMSKIPMLPVRDAALDAALNALTNKQQTITSNGGVAWSPDGRMLSAFKQTPGATVLTILDCATAKPLETLTLRGSSTTSASSTNGGMRWSPDGKRLMILSGAVLFIIEPGGLPHE